MRIGLAVAAAALSVMTVGMAASQGLASTPATGHTVVLEGTGEPNNARAAYKPATLWIEKGGPNLWAQHLRWSQWSAASATGRGQLIGTDSDRMNFGTVTLKLHDVQQNSGKRCFSKIRII